MKIPTVTALLGLLAISPAVSAKNEKVTKPAETNPSAAESAAAIPAAPGAHKKLKCPKNPALTYDIYLPKGYTPPALAAKPADEAAGEACPALFISDPHKNPGFRGLEKWANEKQGGSRHDQ